MLIIGGLTLAVRALHKGLGNASARLETSAGSKSSRAGAQLAARDRPAGQPRRLTV